MTVDQAMTDRFLQRAEAKRLIDVAVTTMDSPVGTLLLMATPKGLVRIAFESENRDDVFAEVAEQLSPRILESPRRLDPVRRELDRYFAGKLRDFEVPIDWSLTGKFARSVLRRTAKIPYGDVATYGEVAFEIGTPRGARAVGNALGSNPIPVVVPCHRVVRAGGAIGGYGGGLPRKQWLLALETAEPATTSREGVRTG
jgi:methylated-DNA-[protein]-cysteine S-methyltransferase